MRAVRQSGREALGATLEGLGVALITLYLAVFVVRNAAIQGDLRAYLCAAQAAGSGLDPYRVEHLIAIAGRHVAPFVYPPVTLPPFMLLAKAGAAAPWIWIGIHVALLAGLVLAWRRWWLPGTSLLALVLVAMLGWNASSLWDLRTGNVALVEAALVWLALGCFCSGRRVAFACLVVAAACFKVMPAAFLLLLLVPLGVGRPKPWMFVASMLALIAITLGPTWIGPAASWNRWFASVPAANTLGSSNPSMLGLLAVVVGACGVSTPWIVPLATGAWCVYALGLLALSLPLLRDAWQRRDARHWAFVAVFLYVLLLPRPMAYGFTLLTPAPFYFAPAPFTGRAGRLLLALVLSTQGLTTIANHPSDSLAFIYAPSLLTVCLWMLIVSQMAHSRVPHEAQLEPAYAMPSA